MKTKTPSDIDEYISTFPEDIQEILQKIRKTVRNAAPDATETISYQIPTFKQSENIVHFAAFSKHISFFPTSSGVRKFRKELAGYETSKGTIKFTLGKPIPYVLISKITKFRVAESMGKEKRKRVEKKKRKDQAIK
jgi:uncharacterized protein YdhG (YjbR/CyaY superfamily)